MHAMTIYLGQHSIYGQTNIKEEGKFSQQTMAAQAQLCHTGQLQKAVASLQVCVLVRLGLGGKCTIRRPEIDQGLHGFQLLWLQQVESGGSQNKVTEATVQLLLEV